MKELKLSEVLSGFDPRKLITNNRPIRFIPMIVEDENKVYQRNQILRSYQTFKQEKNNNYTKKYMSTIYGLLFKNERRYHLKRNKLNINLPESTDEDIAIKLPLTQPNKSKDEIKMNIPLYQKHEPNKSNNIIQKLCDRNYFASIKNKSNFNQRSFIRNDKGRKFRNMAVEKSRLLEIIYTTDEFFKQKAKTKQEQLIRRLQLNGVNLNEQKLSPIDIKYNHGIKVNNHYASRTLNNFIQKK